VVSLSTTYANGSIAAVPEDSRVWSIREIILLGDHPAPVAVNHEPHMAYPGTEPGDSLSETGD
jgi:hypothetical protein